MGVREIQFAEGVESEDLERLPTHLQLRLGTETVEACHCFSHRWSVGHQPSCSAGGSRRRPQTHHRLHVRRPREEVETAQVIGPVPVCVERREVPGQGGWFTGDVDDRGRPGLGHCPDDILCPHLPAADQEPRGRHPWRAIAAHRVRSPSHGHRRRRCGEHAPRPPIAFHQHQSLHLFAEQAQSQKSHTRVEIHDGPSWIDQAADLPRPATSGASRCDCQKPSTARVKRRPCTSWTCSGGRRPPGFRPGAGRGTALPASLTLTWTSAPTGHCRASNSATSSSKRPAVPYRDDVIAAGPMETEPAITVGMQRHPSPATPPPGPEKPPEPARPRPDALKRLRQDLRLQGPVAHPAWCASQGTPPHRSGPNHARTLTAVDAGRADRDRISAQEPAGVLSDTCGDRLAGKAVTAEDHLSVEPSTGPAVCRFVDAQDDLGQASPGCWPGYPDKWPRAPLPPPCRRHDRWTPTATAR